MRIKSHFFPKVKINKKHFIKKVEYSGAEASGLGVPLQHGGAVPAPGYGYQGEPVVTPATSISSYEELRRRNRGDPPAPYRPPQQQELPPVYTPPASSAPPGLYNPPQQSRNQNKYGDEGFE